MNKQEIGKAGQILGRNGWEDMHHGVVDLAEQNSITTDRQKQSTLEEYCITPIAMKRWDKHVEDVYSGHHQSDHDSYLFLEKRVAGLEAELKNEKLKREGWIVGTIVALAAACLALFTS